MKSRTTEEFRDALAGRPADVRKQARKAYELSRENPAHSSLQFKPIQASHSVWSPRVSSQCRVLAFREPDAIVWFWIGSHSDDDRILSQR